MAFPPCTHAAHRFAKKFNLYQYINFKTRVEKLQRCPKSGTWKVSVKRNRHSPCHRAYPDVPAENPEVGVFVGVIFFFFPGVFITLLFCCVLSSRVLAFHVTLWFLLLPDGVIWSAFIVNTTITRICGKDMTCDSCYGFTFTSLTLYTAVVFLLLFCFVYF